MRGRARSLCLLWLGCVLVAAACQQAALAPPAAAPAPAAPARTLNLCERPAKPSAAPQDPQAEASLRAFGRTWLEKMRKADGRKQIRDDFETELRPTGNKQAPWVGIVRYCEKTPSKSTVVTEIFRFEGGKWVY